METLNSISLDETRTKLKGFIYQRVKDKALAEDIVQDVFVKVLTRHAQLKDTHKMTGWIFRIANNAIIDHFRSISKRTAPIADLEDHKHPLNDCVETCLVEMMDELPEKYKEALQLAEVQNLSQTQLAERWSISYSGAKSRVQRARQLLKSMMDKRYNIKADHYGNIVVCENKVQCNCSVPFEEMKSRFV